MSTPTKSAYPPHLVAAAKIIVGIIRRAEQEEKARKKERLQKEGRLPYMVRKEEQNGRTNLSHEERPASCNRGNGGRFPDPVVRYDIYSKKATLHVPLEIAREEKLLRKTIEKAELSLVQREREARFIP